MIDPTHLHARAMQEYARADEEALDPSWWHREITAEQADAIAATTERWFIVAMLLLAAVMFFGVGGGWIVAGVGSLGGAGAVARHG